MGITNAEDGLVSKLEDDNSKTEVDHFEDDSPKTEADNFEDDKVIIKTEDDIDDNLEDNDIHVVDLNGEVISNINKNDHDINDIKSKEMRGHEKE